MKVMELEEAPFNMKIHVFPRDRVPEEEWDEMKNQAEEDVTNKLKDRGVDKDLRLNHVSGPKIRLNFSMSDKDEATSLYRDIAKNSSFFGAKIAATIFYVKSGKFISAWLLCTLLHF
jgi:hypothetical protein